jgi:TPR repeat protein
MDQRSGEPYTCLKGGQQRAGRYPRGHCVKAIILAGISALALGACTSMQHPPAVAPEAILSAPVEFRILSAEEIAASQPRLAAAGDVKAYVADFMTWIAEPGHLVERSMTLMSGDPPDLPADADFMAIIEELAEEGHPAATLMSDSEGNSALLALAAKGDTTAKLAVEMNNINMGSLQQKVDALTWFRSQAPTNRDAAFALGTTLLSQMSSDGMMGIATNGAATPAEVREGAALLVGVAKASSLDIMTQIASMMGAHAGIDAAVDGHTRKILELVVSETKVEPLPELDFSTIDENDMSAYAEYESKMNALNSAVEVRVALAGMLRNGQGGAADADRAKLLYREALEVGQDYRAYEALTEMGVDVSEYDALFAEPDAEGEDWWGLEPEAEEPAPEPAPHQH